MSFGVRDCGRRSAGHGALSFAAPGRRCSLGMNRLSGHKLEVEIPAGFPFGRPHSGFVWCLFRRPAQRFSYAWGTEFWCYSLVMRLQSVVARIFLVELSLSLLSVGVMSGGCKPESCNREGCKPSSCDDLTGLAPKLPGFPCGVKACDKTVFCPSTDDLICVDTPDGTVVLGDKSIGVTHEWCAATTCSGLAEQNRHPSLGKACTLTCGAELLDCSQDYGLVCDDGRWCNPAACSEPKVDDYCWSKCGEQEGQCPSEQSGLRCYDNKWCSPKEYCSLAPGEPCRQDDMCGGQLSCLEQLPENARCSGGKIEWCVSELQCSFESGQPCQQDDGCGGTLNCTEALPDGATCFDDKICYSTEASCPTLGIGHHEVCGAAIFCSPEAAGWRPPDPDDPETPTEFARYLTNFICGPEGSPCAGDAECVNPDEKNDSCRCRRIGRLNCATGQISSGECRKMSSWEETSIPESCHFGP